MLNVRVLSLVPSTPYNFGMMEDDRITIALRQPRSHPFVSKDSSRCPTTKLRPSSDIILNDFGVVITEIIILTMY